MIYMNKKHIFKRLFMVLFTVAFLCSCGENASDSSETTNLFQYALKIEDGIFSPRQADFFMSVEEVLQAAGLNEDAVFEKEDTKSIRTDANIDGFPYDVQAVYDFNKGIGDLLIRVRYLIVVDEAEAADVCNLLYEQAVSTMPEASGNTIEGIKDGTDVQWIDEQQNYVVLTIDKAYSASADHSMLISLDTSVTMSAKPFQVYGDVMEAEIIEVVPYSAIEGLPNIGCLRVSTENGISVIDIQQDTTIQDIDGNQLDFADLEAGQSIRTVTHPRVIHREEEDTYWLCYEIIVK